MFRRELPVRLSRVAAILITMLCAGAVTPLLSQQQALDPARMAPASPTSAAVPGPRSSTLFQSSQTDVTRGRVSEGSSLANHKENHTIVVSTLVLVLGIIIIVLLAT